MDSYSNTMERNMSRLSPPFMPQFGTGAPGAGAATNQPYYDTSTSPFTAYVFDGGIWNKVGGATSSGNASEIQGVPVSAVAPTNGQALVFNSTDGEWEPQT